MNDAGNAWLGPVSLGSSATVQNSQCSINAAGSSASGTGNNLSVDLAITFKSGFHGSKRIYAFAQDASGLASGWQQSGAWTVP
jgi:hypothetical protein